MKNLVWMLGLSLTIGCSTAIVRPYVGEQQAWPTASGAIANTRYDLPVFTSLPPAPYEVLAELRLSSAFYTKPEEGHLPVLVKKAMTLGADALVLVDGTIYFSTIYGVPAGGTGSEGGKKTSLTQVNRFNPETFKPNVSVIAIRWTGELPANLPPRYARYSSKMLSDIPAPAAETSTPPAVKTPKAAPPPAKTEAPHTNFQGKATPVPEPPAAPATSEPAKAEAPPVPAAPATPEPPKAEPAPATGN